MRKTLNLLCSATLIAGSMAFAAPQTSSAAPQEPASGAAKTKIKAMNLTGTVKAYEPGKSIEVDAKNIPHNYDLTATDMTITVGPDVKVGSKVKVTEKADTSGHKTVNIDSSGGTN